MIVLKCEDNMENKIKTSYSDPEDRNSQEEVHKKRECGSSSSELGCHLKTRVIQIPPKCFHTIMTLEI